MIMGLDEYRFALIDLGLHLDIYPNDTNAINLFKGFSPNFFSNSIICIIGKHNLYSFSFTITNSYIIKFITFLKGGELTPPLFIIIEL